MARSTSDRQAAADWRVCQLATPTLEYLGSWEFQADNFESNWQENEVCAMKC